VSTSAAGSSGRVIGRAGDADRPVRVGRGEPGWVSDLVVDLLRELGCRYLPLTPGSSFRGFHDSVVNHGGNRDPQVVLCLHEAIAVAAAHAYAKATGDVAVAVLHDLVGLMNAQMAVYNAWCDRLPSCSWAAEGPPTRPHAVPSTGCTPPRPRPSSSARS
jgi:hypothetical protein